MDVRSRHGFNKKSLGLFFTDLAKNFAVEFVISAPLYSVLIFILRVCTCDADHGIEGGTERVHVCLDRVLRLFRRSEHAVSDRHHAAVQQDDADGALSAPRPHLRAGEERRLPRRPHSSDRQ